MSTPASPIVVEKPPVVEQLSEQEITDTYLEQRKDGKVTDLPVPPPTIPEVIPAPVIEPPATAPEVIETNAVERYLEERKEGKERKRRERGGAQARIDQLTKEKAELEIKVAAIPPPVTPPVVAPITPPAVVPPPAVLKAAPKMNEFTDADEYHAAMALWANDERMRTAPAPVPVPVVPQEPQYLQVRKEEFDKFLENGKRFIAGHSDFNETLEAAHIRGLTMSESARTAITRLAVPEVAYWLAKPENDLAARRLMQMDDLQQTVEVGRIAERLAVSPADFVSNAPPPGTRLAGGGYVSELPLNQVMDTDEYIRRRKQERRGRR